MFAFRIREIREEKNISLRKLSDLTGISLSYLSELENNKKYDPSLNLLYKIAVTLDVNIKNLFYSKLDIKDLKEDMYRLIDEKRNDTFGYIKNKSINRFINKYRYKRKIISSNDLIPLFDFL